MSDVQTIYVELLDEGVQVYRPVEATPHEDGSFQLPDSTPVDEVWAFEPGSRVFCELRDIGGAERSLLATRSAPDA